MIALFHIPDAVVAPAADISMTVYAPGDADAHPVTADGALDVSGPVCPAVLLLELIYLPYDESHLPDALTEILFVSLDLCVSGQAELVTCPTLGPMGLGPEARELIPRLGKAASCPECASRLIGSDGDGVIPDPCCALLFSAGGEVFAVVFVHGLVVFQNSEDPQGESFS